MVGERGIFTREYVRTPSFFETRVEDTQALCYFSKSPEESTNLPTVLNNYGLFDRRNFSAKVNLVYGSKERRNNPSGDSFALIEVVRGRSVISMMEVQDGLSPINSREWGTFVKINHKELAEVENSLRQRVWWEYPDSVLWSINNSIYRTDEFREFVEFAGGIMKTAEDAAAVYVTKEHQHAVLDSVHMALLDKWSITRGQYRRRVLQPVLSSPGWKPEWVNSIHSTQLITVIQGLNDERDARTAGVAISRSLADIQNDAVISGGDESSGKKWETNANGVVDNFAAEVIHRWGEEGKIFLQKFLYPHKIMGVYSVYPGSASELGQQKALSEEDTFSRVIGAGVVFVVDVGAATDGGYRKRRTLGNQKNNDAAYYTQTMELMATGPVDVFKSIIDNGAEDDFVVARLTVTG